MKPKEIQEIIDFIAKSGLDEVNIETDQFKLSVKRQATKISASVTETHFPSPIANTQHTPPALFNTNPSTENTPPAVPTTSVEEPKYITIKSPMIGTFYRSPKPEIPSFVNIGDPVSKGQTVCIIEAMKLFNEIESEFSGKIVKVLVENASPVEYDQPLFLVDPS